MLSPSVNSAKDLLTQVLNEMLRIDGYATGAGAIVVGKLPEDPDWLASVRSRVAMLAAAGGKWLLAKPGIWGPILNQFSSYNAALAGLVEAQKAGQPLTAENWVEILDAVLVPQLEAAAAATDAAAAALKEQLDSFADIQPLLEESIDAGWAALAEEEQQMVRIAAELAHLQDLVASLEDEVTSGSIGAGKGVVSTTVSTVYDVAVVGAESVSFLSFVTSAITVGQFFYTLAESSAELTATLQQIAALQIEASEEAQAAAGTKMVLQLLYNLQTSFDTIGNVVPQLSTLWRDQLERVRDAVDALNSGSDPSTYFDLLTLPTASANWNVIAQFAALMPTLVIRDGEPVLLNPQQPQVRSA
jgi:hypothetical protein